MGHVAGSRLNKANSGPGRPVQGATRLPVPPVGRVVQTKPIGRHGDRQAQADKAARVIGRTYRAKRSQFPEGLADGLWITSLRSQ